MLLWRARCLSSFYYVIVWLELLLSFHCQTKWQKKQEILDVSEQTAVRGERERGTEYPPPPYISIPGLG